MSANTYKDCGKCGTPVHRNSKVTCKACGGPSPWAEASVDAEPGVAGSVPPATAADASAASVPPDAEAAAFISTLMQRPNQSQLRAMGGAEIDLSPTDAEVADFHARQPAVIAAAAEKAEHDAAEAALNGPHVFLEKYGTQIGATMAHFKQGQVITDFALIQYLRGKMVEGETVPMVPTTGAPGMTCCPKCRHTFRVPTIIPAKRAG